LVQGPSGCMCAHASPLGIVVERVCLWEGVFEVFQGLGFDTLVPVPVPIVEGVYECHEATIGFRGVVGLVGSGPEAVDVWSRVGWGDFTGLHLSIRRARCCCLCGMTMLKKK
jgi:hypothetical protein